MYIMRHVNIRDRKVRNIWAVHVYRRGQECGFLIHPLVCSVQQAWVRIIEGSRFVQLTGSLVHNWTTTADFPGGRQYGHVRH